MCRGLDDDGHTGNCVETELLISTNKHTFSYVQIRGTFPLFWEQKQHGLKTEINTIRPEALAKPKFATHFESLLRDYQTVLLINLVRKNMPEEHGLTESLQRMFKLFKRSNDPADLDIRTKVKHVMFDFHAETKGDNFASLDKFTSELAEI